MPATYDRFKAFDNEPPTASFARVRPRTNTSRLCLWFSANDVAVFPSLFHRSYNGGGLAVVIYWMAPTAIAGGVTWGADVERNQAGVTNLTSDSFGTQTTAAGTANGTAGVLTATTVTIPHANLGGLSAGEPYRLRITCTANTLGEEAQLYRIEVRSV